MTGRELLSIPRVAGATARTLGAGTSAGDVADAVRVESRNGSDLYDVKARASSSGQAARIANTLCRFGAVGGPLPRRR